MPDFMPSEEGPFTDWSQNFKTQVDVNADQIGVTPAQNSSLSSKFTIWLGARNDFSNAKVAYDTAATAKMKTKNLLILSLTLVAGTTLVSTRPIKAAGATAQAPAKQAQTENPNLQDTLDWLSGKIHDDAKYELKHKDKGGSISFVGRSYEFAILEAGRVEITDRNSVVLADDTGKTLTDVKYTTKDSLSLKDFDPLTVSLSVEDPTDGYSRILKGPQQIYVVRAETTNHKPTIERNFKYSRDALSVVEKESKESVLTIHFPDKDIAERVAKALKHAIELSGGKASKEAF